MTDPKPDDASLEARNRLRSCLLTYTGDPDLKSCENPINMPKHIAQIYNESLVTKGALTLPFVSLLIGTPVKMSDSDIEAFYNEIVSKPSRRSVVAAGIAEKLKSIPFRDFLFHCRSLPYMTLQGTTCRVSRVCDVCDFTVAVAELVKCSYIDASKCCGSGFGHASIAKGFTPFLHRRLSCKRDNDFSKLGFFESECNFRWGAEKRTTTGTLRNNSVNTVITQFLSEARDNSNESEQEDAEVADILKDPVTPAPEPDTSHLMSLDTALAMSSVPEPYSCVSPTYAQTAQPPSPQTVSKKRPLDSDSPKPPESPPARIDKEDTSSVDTPPPDVVLPLKYVESETYEP